MLCDPDLNDGFVSACKKKSLPGDARAWNSLLLRIRKAGKLPKMDRPPTRLSSAEMDAYSAASEAAMQLLSLDYGLTLDEILCSPVVAAEFDRMAAQFCAEEHKPFDYRWAAMVIRKRAKKSRELATKFFQDWLTKQLPRSLPLERCVAMKYERPGVYVVVDRGDPLYVGETLNVRRRAQQILDNESWGKFGPRSMKLFEPDSQQRQYGLQSILIGRTNPILNSVLLRPDCEPAA